jgi:hypothetical protein
MANEEEKKKEAEHINLKVKDQVRPPGVRPRLPALLDEQHARAMAESNER